jgi:hypothetical protein
MTTTSQMENMTTTAQIPHALHGDFLFLLLREPLTANHNALRRISQHVAASPAVLGYAFGQQGCLPPPLSPDAGSEFFGIGDFLLEHGLELLLMVMLLLLLLLLKLLKLLKMMLLMLLKLLLLLVLVRRWHIRLIQSWSPSPTMHPFAFTNAADTANCCRCCGG